MHRHAAPWERQQPPVPEAPATRRPSRHLPARCLLLLFRVAQVAILAWIAMRVPVPLLDQSLSLKGPLVSLLAVLAVGKAVYDTFFYDRFWP